MKVGRKRLREDRREGWKEKEVGIRQKKNYKKDWEKREMNFVIERDTKTIVKEA